MYAIVGVYAWQVGVDVYVCVGGYMCECGCWLSNGSEP